jgi:hypothetical protein
MVQAASSCGMHHTFAKSSALTPLDLPAESAAIVANAVVNIAEAFSINMSQAVSSIDTLPNVMET